MCGLPHRPSDVALWDIVCSLRRHLAILGGVSCMASFRRCTARYYQLKAILVEGLPMTR
jgi:hypothetical protein